MKRQPAGEAKPGNTDAVLVLAGSPGFGEARPLYDAARVAAQTTGNVIVDCATAEHLNAAVLQILLGLARELKATGRDLRLVNVPPSVDRVLGLTGLQTLRTEGDHS